jgi:hypothetical protein
VITAAQFSAEQHGCAKKPRVWRLIEPGELHAVLRSG